MWKRGSTAFVSRVSRGPYGIDILKPSGGYGGDDEMCIDFTYRIVHP
jgi:hypothetical protein